jgi:hypothetical protein
MKRNYAVERILDYLPSLKPDGVASRLRNSSFVSLPRRYMYFDVPKAACSTMKHLLRRLEGLGPLKRPADPGWLDTRRDMWVHDRSNLPLPSLVELDEMTQREVIESPHFFRMVVVRNPYTRLVSAWKDKVFLCDEITGRDVYLQIKGRLPEIHEQLPISFDEFVQFVEGQCNLPSCDFHWKRQVEYTFFPAMNFSHVIKIEELKEGLRQFQRHLGLSEPLVADGRNESLPLGKATYTKELADRVYSLYRPDFDSLGYDRETWAAPARRSLNEQPGFVTLSEDRLRDEIMERNLVILDLYEERERLREQLRRVYEDRERLREQLRRVSRLHLLSAVNGLAALNRASRKFVRNVRERAHRIRSEQAVTPREILKT